MKVPVYNQQADKVDEIELNSKIFEVKPTKHLLAEAVRVQLSNARAGSSNTKTRGEVSGGGKKPWKQKGTGRARAGSIRSPIWRGGGITFGPRSNRNWELKINKKAKTKALFMSLSDKAASGNIFVIDQISFETPKTKEFVKLIKAFNEKAKASGKKSLVMVAKKDEAILRASRNIPNVSSILASSLNVVDVLNADNLLVIKNSLPVIEKTYLKVKEKAK